MGRATRGWFAAAALATVWFAAGPQALADGALAVGTTGDVVKDGVAFGMVVDEPEDKAAPLAVQRCRTFKATAAAERCKLVATFKGQCFAVAYDPQPGTPGAGWGIGPDQLSANAKAIAMCEKSAGPGRAGFCQVESGGCDTHAKGDAATTTDADKAAPPHTAVTPPPKPADEDRQWNNLRKSLEEEQRNRSDWDMLLLLVVVGAIGWVLYAVCHTWRARAAAQAGKSEPAQSGPAKGKAPKGAAPKGKAKRSSG